MCVMDDWSVDLTSRFEDFPPLTQRCQIEGAIAIHPPVLFHS